MAQPKKVFRCKKCDAQYPRWEGRCRECGAWDNLEESINVAKKQPTNAKGVVVSFQSLGSTTNSTPRLQTGSQELDRVLGGGIVTGALLLLGGNPGIGKSTLLLQVASLMANSNKTRPVLYVSGEESGEQVRLRLDRLRANPDNLQFLGESMLPTIMQAVNEQRPQLVIIDSLQTIRSETGAAAGRPGELRDAMEALMELAKTTATPIIIVGHVTKRGDVAGPKVLEHLVDAVLYFEASEDSQHRLLYTTKNRFGGSNEVGVWKMEESGLTEIANPAGVFLNTHRPTAPGATVLPVLKGSRVFLVEVQALVTKTRFAHPQRRSTGFDLNRLQLLIAVLSKHLHLPLAYHDVHLNIVGGLKVTEPAADVAVALAIASAAKNVALPKDLAACGEVGLHAEVRAIPELMRRVETAARVGLRQLIAPEQSTAEQQKNSLTVYKAATLASAIEIAFPH